MSLPKKNKKRNSLLVFEFLIKRTAKTMSEGKDTEGKKIVSLIKNNFVPGSELFKEYNLCKSLYVTQVSSESVAANILQQARNYALTFNEKSLEAQKTKLIESIEKLDKSGLIYEANIQDYKIMSSIGFLVREWTKKDVNLLDIAKEEDIVAKHLVRKSIVETKQEKSNLSEFSLGEKRFIFMSLKKKFEEKWKNKFSDSQIDFLRKVAINEKREEFIQEAKDKCIKIVDKLVETKKIDENSASSVKKQILSESNIVDEKTITNFMLYLDLEKDLETP